MNIELTALPVRTTKQWYFMPSWHQAMYNAAAQRVHWALRREQGNDDEFQKRADALEDADRIARRLLLVATQAVIELGSGRRARRRIGSAAETRAIHTFLVETVEGSAAVLLGGIRVELGIEYEPVVSDLFPLPRPSLVEQLVEEEYLAKRSLRPGYLAAYAAAPPEAGGRVEYNLACFYSTVGWKQRRNKGASATALDLAARHLRRASARLNAQDRRALTEWIDRDPSLLGLRELARDKYEAVVEPMRRARPPAARVAKPKPMGWWRRALRRLGVLDGAKA